MKSNGPPPLTSATVVNEESMELRIELAPLPEKSARFTEMSRADRFLAASGLVFSSPSEKVNKYYLKKCGTYEYNHQTTTKTGQKPRQTLVVPQKEFI